LAPEAGSLLKVVRAHWGVENSGHWSLDVSFDGDGCRVRKDHAPFNFAVLRRMALNLLRQEPSGKTGSRIDDYAPRGMEITFYAFFAAVKSNAIALPSSDL
jgi:hypothetical protein